MDSLGEFLKRYIILFSVILFLYINVSGANSGIVKVVDQNSSILIGNISSIQVGRYLFVSLEEFANVLNLSVSYFDNIKKATLNIANHSITVSALNPFINIDNSIYQMPVNIYFKEDDYLVPVKFFVNAIKDVFNGHIEYNQSLATIEIIRDRNNIIGVSTEKKANGTLIRIATARPFDQSNIFTSTSQGWLLVDIYGGKIDTIWTPRPEPGSIISEINPVQLSDESARLAFKIASPIIDVRILPSANTSEIVISLRTKETLSNTILDELERERQKWNIDCIIIDPGHGGRDPGTIGSRGTYEKNITLMIAKKLKNLLQTKLGIKVILTRDSDKAIGLKERTQMANQKGGKLFISIHIDWYKSPRVGGCTTYFLGPAKTEEAREVARLENSVIHFEESPQDYFILAAMAQNLFTKESQDLAAIVQEEMKKHVNIQTRGVKQNAFYVLYGASMPCILHESAFISNPKEEKLLQSSSFQQDIAEALYESVRKFKEKYEKEM